MDKKLNYEIKMPVFVEPALNNWMQDWIDRIYDTKRLQREMREKKLKRILNEKQTEL